VWKLTGRSWSDFVTPRQRSRRPRPDPRQAHTVDPPAGQTFYRFFYRPGLISAASLTQVIEAATRAATVAAPTSSRRGGCLGEPSPAEWSNISPFARSDNTSGFVSLKSSPNPRRTAAGSAKTEAAEARGLRRKVSVLGPHRSPAHSPADPHRRGDPRKGEPHSEHKTQEK
jgi:hypothetical protein